MFKFRLLTLLMLSNFIIGFSTEAAYAQVKVVDLKGTDISKQLMSFSEGFARGNKRSADVTLLTLDPKTGKLSGKIVINNRHEIVKKDFFPTKTKIPVSIYNHKMNAAFKLDLNKPEKEVVIFVGKETKINSKELLKSIGVEANWSLLTVKSKPDQVDIYINGNKWGKTRKDGFAGAGKYKLTLKKAGYRTIEEEVTLVKGKTTDKFYALEKK